jgi:hypothetical protein
MRFVVMGIFMSGSVAIASYEFGAIENRPLWDRPGDGVSLQQETESALDRGNERVEGEALFELRLLERDRAIDAGRIERKGEIERYREEIDRAEQLAQVRIRAQQHQERARRFEREAEALAQQRAAWRAIVQRENAAGGAVVDRQALERVEADYRAALANAQRRRDVALNEAGEDRAARARATQQYERAKADAMQQRAARREVILGR